MTPRIVPNGPPTCSDVAAGRSYERCPRPVSRPPIAPSAPRQSAVGARRQPRNRASPRIVPPGNGASRRKKTILVALIGTAMAAAIAATGCSGSARTGGSPSSSPSPDQLPKGVLAVIPVMGGPLGLGACFGKVTVTTENGIVLYRIDPATNKVVAQIDVGQAMCGTPAFGFGRVWVPDCNFGPHGLVVVDPATNHVVRTLADQVAGSVGIGAGSVWAGPRIDPATLSEQPLLRTGHDDLAIM